MGIKNLYKFLTKFAPNSIRDITIEDIANSRVAIDMNLYIYQWYTTSRNYNIVNTSGDYINHIQGAFHKLSAMIANNISVICVFDGPPPSTKSNTIAKRKQLKQHRPGPTAQIFAQVKELLDLMKIKYIDAPSEAEAQCAAYYMLGYVDYVITEDLDALVFGASAVVRGIGKNKSGVLIDKKSMLQELSLTDEQFINLCVLLGSDYTSHTLSGIGMVKAYTLIKKHGSIDTIIKEENKRDDTFDYNGAISTFKYFIASTEDPNISSSKLNRAEHDRLYDYLVNIMGLSKAKILSNLLRISTK